MTDEQFEGFLALLQRIVVAVEYPRLKEEEDQLRRWEYVKNLPLAMRPGVCQNCPFCGAESHLMVRGVDIIGCSSCITKCISTV